MHGLRYRNMLTGSGGSQGMNINISSSSSYICIVKPLKNTPSSIRERLLYACSVYAGIQPRLTGELSFLLYVLHSQ